MNLQKIVYLRKEENNKSFGALVADIDTEAKTAIIGWSVCHKNDVFLRKLAREIAMDRATKRKCGAEVPMNIYKDVLEFGSRVAEKFGLSEDQIAVLDGHESRELDRYKLEA